MTITFVPTTNTVPVLDRSKKEDRLQQPGAATAAPGGEHPLHYQKITLDLKNQTLQFACSDWRGETREHREYVNVPDPFRGTRINWVIETDGKGRPYFTNEEGDRFVRELLPLAQKLTESLIPIPGEPGAWDWSIEAVEAADEITARCHFTSCVKRPVVDAETYFRVIPEDLPPDLDEATTEWLDKQAYWISRPAPDRVRRLEQHLGISLDGLASPRVVGVHAYLRRLREEAAAGLKVMHAKDWFAQHPELGAPVAADDDDAKLEERARNYRTAALKEGVKLVGLPDHLRNKRREERDRVREDLRRFGAEAAELRARLTRMIGLRNGLLTRVLTWEDPLEKGYGGRWNYTHIAALAGMTRQGAEQLVPKLFPTVGDLEE